MQFLHKPCQECNKPMNGGVYRKAHVCPHCGFTHEGGKANLRVASKPSVKTSALNESKPARTKTVANPLQPAEVKLVDKPVAEGELIAANLGNINSDSIADIKLMPDMFENGKFVGAKNKIVQAAFNRAKKEALNQLRRQAALLGANTVAEVTVKFSMKGRDAQKANLIVKASGEALVLDISANIESA